ncbi:MAG: acyl-CoA dehydrogenase C-terminal domain-containing protein [Proteobacteria bacterium]|nr:acyl-CoA dehydrogenase C-terminal domain-containing protein [Pseudomonadota bacterium]MDA1354644.1 acyl-CoA dehydrogenase C-terminal domain-containing protein [Pseudomonadota bacterium]
MQIYKAPLRDMRFVLHEMLDSEQLSRLPGFEEATPETIDAILEEGAKFCEDKLLPLNRVGDEEGCTYENGVVRTPTGFKQAYDDFVGAGWQSISSDPKYGGQGLPALMNFVIEEMVCSTNIAFGVYPLLSRGAAALIERHGSETIKDTYLPHLTDGSWSGTMCLTESHCGTDLGLIRTKAAPTGGGAYSISGSKMFISAGEHDLVDNIIHLVLAKLPDAPEGVRGISLFLVPKFNVKGSGASAELGPRNGVSCGSIEKKMGIHGSATCVINFDEAEGYLIGEAHKGLRCMFTMMNGARLGVGMQGLAIGETAYQSATAYAKERRSGKSLAKGAKSAEAADPIIVHPDVRNMLLTVRAYNEGTRALAYWTALKLDISTHHPDAETRRDADELVQLMTPIIKAFLTDRGFEGANLAVQVHGGHGYIAEHGMEQLVRDARIAQLYEGTNGIQALDLVGRKLGLHTGRLLRLFFHPATAFVEAHQNDEALREIVMPLAKALGKLQQATLVIAQKGLGDPEEAAAVATDYLKMFGLVAVGYMWAMMAEKALAKAGDDANGDARYYANKVKTARFYMYKLLPESASLFLRIMTGKAAIAHFDEDDF